MNKIKIERNNKKERKKEKKRRKKYRTTTLIKLVHIDLNIFSKKKGKKRKKLKVNFISAYTHPCEREINFTSVALIKRTLPLSSPFRITRVDILQYRLQLASPGVVQQRRDK